MHATAGGVGLKAAEYVLWLSATLVGTAGRPHKHEQLQITGVVCRCSSRDGAVFSHAAGHVATPDKVTVVIIDPDDNAEENRSYLLSRTTKLKRAFRKWCDSTGCELGAAEFMNLETNTLLEVDDTPLELGWETGVQVEIGVCPKA